MTSRTFAPLIRTRSADRRPNTPAAARRAVHTMQLLPRLLLAVAVIAPTLFASGCADRDPITTPERFDRFMMPDLADQIQGWQSWPRIETGFPEQIEAGRHNWSNLVDASSSAGVEVFGDMLRMVAVVQDDVPLNQPFERLRHPDWWGIPVSGDAIELHLRPTDLGREPFEATIQLGSEGLNPQLIVTRAPRGQVGPVPDAIVTVQRVQGGYQLFVQLVEINRWGVVPFYTSGYEISVVLHDTDGDPASYTRLRGTTTTRP